jgi:ATP phosphoribosyltransferase
MHQLTLALTKGRVLAETLALLKAIHIEPLEDPARSRKLVFETTRENVRLMILRSSDVPTYVEHGIADLGICGKDVLVEHGEQGYYEPLDLKIGTCRLMTAGLVDEPPLPARIKVATKFVNIAKRYYAEKGVQVDLIKLYGAMELAPLVGLSHRIVDIVETGNTLKANGMQPLDLIMQISCRLIVNKFALKMKHDAVKLLMDSLADTIEKR